MIIYLVVAFAGFTLYGCRWLMGSMKPQANREKENLKKTINDLRQTAEELNNPSTYASYSKLNRKIQTMEKELHQMPDTLGQSQSHWTIALMPYAAALLFIGQTEKLNIYGEDVYWPIHTLIGYQENKVFHLSLSSWYLICLIVIKSLV